MKGFLSKQEKNLFIHSFLVSWTIPILSLQVIKQTERQLQLIQTAAARVLTNPRKLDQTKLVITSLHWLPVSHRLDFKIRLLLYEALNSLVPKYMPDLLVSNGTSRPLYSSGTGLLCVLITKTKLVEGLGGQHSVIMLLNCGTNFL